MEKVLVRVKIRDCDSKYFEETTQVEIDVVDYLILKDNMDTCSNEKFLTSWEHLIDAISDKVEFLLPLNWYIEDGTDGIKLVTR